MLASSTLDHDINVASMAVAGTKRQIGSGNTERIPPINGCKTAADLRAWLLAFARGLGFYGGRYIHIGHALWGRERVDAAARRPQQDAPRTASGATENPWRYRPIRFLSTSSRDGTDHDEQNWLISDPVVDKIRSAFTPFPWTTCPGADLSDAQRAWVNVERAQGVGAGIAVPVQDYVSGPAYLSFFGVDEAAARRILEERAPELAFLGAQFHALAKTLMPTMDGGEFISVLTSREIECLRLAALGRTVDESGRQLGISGRTVEFHLKNAGEKLGASTKLRTVVVALLGGLLQI